MRRPRAFPTAATLALALLASGPPAAAQTASGTVTISQTQVALLVSGALGGGVLTYEGREHPFTIGGLGYGGLGISTIEASGKVYGLERLEDFEGPFAQGRAGAVAGTEQVEGGIWLVNPQGVTVELKSRREGYALSLGGDAVFVKFK
ncbi:hypothetical protein SAMN05444336_10115 [Albimonas donghaensis]|uniref:Uncharacterized protein n=1 Tax=Albimonas donghaensis TaxID=356660 RepID=A0A1H2QE68_9RHOB|nr:hypothetical protein [Albimonas donghaensis]SDW04944.1 hypothetical protein SAMN05444336_10115 [Albimonas donghaensis]